MQKQVIGVTIRWEQEYNYRIDVNHDKESSDYKEIKISSKEEPSFDENLEVGE